MSEKIYGRRNFLKLSGGSALSGFALPKKEKSPLFGDSKTIRLGFIGIGGRGSNHLDAALGIDGVVIAAICDTNPTNLYQAKKWIEDAGQASPKLYDRGPEDYKRLCQEENLDAVICATPWDIHAAVCLEAMRNGKHAACEVPQVQTLDEAWELVETYEKTGKWASIVLGGFADLALLNMIRKGVLGDIIHVESGYVHDLRLVKFDPEREPWRLQPAIDRNGNLYPDHPMRNMMPSLDINRGDRFDFLVSMSSKSVMLNKYAASNFGPKHPYATQKTSLGDFNATLLRTVNGKMVTLNHDTHTPHPRENYRIQGTKGVYNGDADSKRIYLDGVSPKAHDWESADKYLKEYEHPIVKAYNPPARKTGAIRGHGSHSTQTPINWSRLIESLRNNTTPDWDVYDSVTSSAIIPLTAASVGNKSKPIDFPDFTKGKWKTRPSLYA